MKFIVLFLLAIASAASHAMWVTVTRNEVATVYIDSSAITKMGYNRRVWVVYDLTSPDKTGQQSVKSHISATSHPNKMGNGPAIKALPVPEGWRPVSQDSMSRQLFAFACAW
jgi:hypothetical protein